MPQLNELRRLIEFYADTREGFAIGASKLKSVGDAQSALDAELARVEGRLDNAEQAARYYRDLPTNAPDAS